MLYWYQRAFMNPQSDRHGGRSLPAVGEPELTPARHRVGYRLLVGPGVPAGPL